MMDVAQAVQILAYAEARAIMLGWAGVRSWDPVLQTRAVVASVVRGPRGDLVGRAQEALRAETRAVLDAALRRDGAWPFDRHLGPGQLGSTAGVEAIFHDAGRRAAAHRDGDPRLLALAVRLTDFLRNSGAAQPTRPA